MIQNSYSRTYDASPSFNWTNASLTAGSTEKTDWESYDKNSAKYLPFNFTRIVNNGEVDIWFYPNQDTTKGVFVPKGTIISIDRATIPALSRFSIKNNDASTTLSAGKLIITNSREAQTTDSIVGRLHKRLLSPFFGGV